MSNRFDVLFDKKDGKFFMPFFTLGYPDPDKSLDLIKAVIDAGAHALELGIPFSDPMADGPQIQHTMEVALKNGMHFDAALKMIEKIRAYAPDLPIGLLLYYNLLFAAMREDPEVLGKTSPSVILGLDPGIQSKQDFRESGNNSTPVIYHRLKSIGVDAVLCPELPLEESAQHEAYLKASGLGCVHMVFPNTPLDRAAQSFERSSAFTYVVARSGITGASQSLDSALQQRLGELNKISEKPKVVGFGLSTQEHVRSVWAAGADGSIVASQFVRWMQELPFDEAKAKVVEFVRALA